MREFTKYVHGKEVLGEKFTRSLSVPIYQTAIFTFSSAEEGAGIIAKEKEGYFYTRLGNPTIKAFEEKMAFLEEGEDACAFASGMAAISAVIFSLIKAGDEILASYPIYGCTYSLFTSILPNLGIKAEWLMAKNFAEELKKKINKRTKIVFIETPTNPTIEVIDIEEISEIAHRYNAKVVVDNTFATTFNQKPLKLKADISLHSATKYISGHGDTLGGVVISDKETIKNLKENLIRNFGAVISPFNAWLLLRGLKTLALRMSKHNENGLKVAQFLENHPKIQWVSYPGLPSHPQYEIAKKQMNGFSGMIAFELKGGREAGRKLMNNIKLCVCAVSLGDTATLIEHPASMTHFTYSKEDLEKSGISEGLVRMSVGIEDAEDIIEDLKQALAKV
ncbi:MAG: aminotransferase class I/II-fold pyridoxal phosphate-dependent enzyme [candidate division WOR-3 bacterium]